jgi:hypothetical protein
MGCEAVLGIWVPKRFRQEGQAGLSMFEKPVLEVQDAASYDVVRSAIQSALAQASAGKFLKQVDSRKMRVRDFESVLAKGLLGQESIAAYGRLGDLDRGQIRELYLASVEHVAPELRSKYLKVYAYY